MLVGAGVGFQNFSEDWDEFSHICIGRWETIPVATGAGVADPSRLSGDPSGDRPADKLLPWRHEHWSRRLFPGPVCEKFFGNSLYLSVLAETVAYALIVCLGCLVLGFPVGYSLARHPPAERRLRMLMVIVPLTLSLVVVVFGWLVLLGRQGLVNNVLVWLGIVTSPQQLLFNRAAVVIVLIQQFLPFMIISVMNVVMQIDPVLEQASTSLRANRARTFLKVIIPLSTPGILAGLSLIFVMAVSAFVTPRLVGAAGPDGRRIHLRSNSDHVELAVRCRDGLHFARGGLWPHGGPEHGHHSSAHARSPCSVKPWTGYWLGWGGWFAHSSILR